MQYFLRYAVLVLALASTANAAADGLRSRLQPGQVLNYEFEGHFGFVPQQTPLAQETEFFYRGPVLCDYYFSTLIELRILKQTPENGLEGTATYLHPTLIQWQCPDLDLKNAEDRLRALGANPMPFSVNSRGEITFPPVVEQQLDFRGTFRLLTSSTMDLLHTILASGPVAAGQEWKPRDNFIYWKEYVDTGLELSASIVKYVRDLRIAGDDCAELDFRYIFAPEDMAATASTPQGKVRVDYAGNVSTGLLKISTLFDRTTGHIAWIRRSREIENRLYLGRDTAGATGPLTRFRMLEESTVRQLRSDSPLEWSAGLRSFEEAGGAPPQRSTAADSGPLMRAALEARSRRHPGDVETQEIAPRGYTRYEKRLCSSTWSCSVVSIALPGSVQIADDTPLRITFLASSGTAVASINIGPDQQKIVRGLSDQEELHKNVLAFLAGKMWLRAGPGTPLIMSETYIEDYPALITDFNTSRLDGLQMEGKLASILTTWGEIITAGCAYSQSDARTQEQVCRQVLGSIRVRQIEP